MRARTRSLTVAAGLALALSLTGCSAIQSITGGDEPVRGEDGQITEASDAGATTLQVGDCLVASELGLTVETVPTKPCSEAHDAEVYAAKELADGDYPTDITDQADEFCLESFEPYVGIAYEESELNVSSLYPDSTGWTLGDHEVVCLVISDEADLTESLKGAAR